MLQHQVAYLLESIFTTWSYCLRVVYRQRHLVPDLSSPPGLPSVLQGNHYLELRLPADKSTDGVDKEPNYRTRCWSAFTNIHVGLVPSKLAKVNGNQAEIQMSVHAQLQQISKDFCRPSREIGCPGTMEDLDSNGRRS